MIICHSWCLLLCLFAAVRGRLPFVSVAPKSVVVDLMVASFCVCVAQEFPNEHATCGIGGRAVKTGSCSEVVTLVLRWARGEIEPWRFATSRLGAGRPYSPVRGPSGLPKRGLVAPGAGTKVPRRLRLGPAVNWEWRGRPSSREWLPWSSLWLRVWGWDPNCGPAGRYWDRPSWPSWLAPHLPEFSREFRPLHVGPCGAAPLGCGSPRCCRAKRLVCVLLVFQWPCFDNDLSPPQTTTFLKMTYYIAVHLTFQRLAPKQINISLF